MKKIFTLITALTLSVGLWAINNVPYIDANGQEQKANNVTGVINSTDTLKAGWYVVMPTGSAKRTGTLVCQGEVHLIVYDGAILTATGADGKPGIEVSGEGNSLTIYGYTNQSGQLIAIGGANAAGIGGGKAAAGSNITICGGIVTANGGENASAIGSGNGGDAASNIFVATSFVVKADGNNPPTTVIAATRTATTDIAADLAGQRYATIYELTPVVSEQFVDPTSGLKFYVSAVGEANTVKVIKDNYTGTSYTIPATVKYKEVDFAVTEIENSTFKKCSSLQSVTIPASVTTIGSQVFYECTGLTSVTFLGNACQNNIGEDAFYSVGSTEIPATLVLPDTWTGSTPDQAGNWYGGKFELSEDPSALPKVDETGITVNGRKYGFPVRLVKEVK